MRHLIFTLWLLSCSHIRWLNAMRHLIVSAHFEKDPLTTDTKAVDVNADPTTADPKVVDVNTDPLHNKAKVVDVIEDPRCSLAKIVDVVAVWNIQPSQSCRRQRILASYLSQTCRRHCISGFVTEPKLSTSMHFGIATKPH